jgi:hypothetical protein
VKIKRSTEDQAVSFIAIVCIYMLLLWLTIFVADFIADPQPRQISYEQAR